MPEATFAEMIIPGTFIRVQADALISVGGITTGNIGIVGTAVLEPNAAEQSNFGTFLLSDYNGARTLLGTYDAFSANAQRNLVRGIELLYKNGARTVFARAIDPADGDDLDAYTAAFTELVKDNINILVAPELSTEDAIAVLQPILDSAEDQSRDIIAVIGSDADAASNVAAQVPTNDRIIFTAPGIRAYDAAAKDAVDLPGTYSAAAVAGLISALAPQSSPTNKVLPGVVKLTKRFSYGETVSLLQGRVLVLEERGGVRVVRGITTDDAAFRQITTRRITDFAKAGIRQASNPFIGRLNNQRVRKALQGAINGFLTTMVQDEALISYSLEVTATRDDEIAGRAIVTAILQPTFSIDYIAVTLVLQ